MPAERGQGPLGIARYKRVPWIIAAVVLAILVLGSALVWHAEARTNKVAMADSPKPVSFTPAHEQSYRPVRTYIGALRPWVEAKLGPQFISAYVDTVLVRPGAVVRKGQVLATLDCRNATAATAAISSQAKAIAARQQALSHEAMRTRALLDGGFVSPNETEQITARSESEASELAAQQANLTRSALDVGDCVLRSPFDGEVSVRLVDPGAFVRPGTEMIGVLDRSTVRLTADAPEMDFGAVRPGADVEVHLVSINANLPAKVTRRAPSADPGTRTVHFEIDLDDADRTIPVDTTGEVHVPVDAPVRATSIPLSATSISDNKATFFTVTDGVAHRQTAVELGEAGARVFFGPETLKPGTDVVMEGRSLLKDGDRVTGREVDEDSGTLLDSARSVPPPTEKK